MTSFRSFQCEAYCFYPEPSISHTVSRAACDLDSEMLYHVMNMAACNVPNLHSHPNSLGRPQQLESILLFGLILTKLYIII